MWCGSVAAPTAYIVAHTCTRQSIEVATTVRVMPAPRGRCTSVNTGTALVHSRSPPCCRRQRSSRPPCRRCKRSHAAACAVAARRPQARVQLSGPPHTKTAGCGSSTSCHSRTCVAGRCTTAAVLCRPALQRSRRPRLLPAAPGCWTRRLGLPTPAWYTARWQAARGWGDWWGKEWYELCRRHRVLALDAYRQCCNVCQQVRQSAAHLVARQRLRSCLPCDRAQQAYQQYQPDISCAAAWQPLPCSHDRLR